MKKNLQLLVAAIAITIMAFNLESCTSYRGIASRPDGHNHWRPDFAGIHIKKHHQNDKANARTTAMANTTKAPLVPTAEHKTTGVVAQITGDAPFKARIPKLVSKDITDDNIVKVNDALAKYSNHKVSIAKTANGKFYLKADSRKDFVKLTKTLLRESKSAAPISDEARDILALVGGICGIVAIGLSVIPYADFLSIPAGVAGIVLGVLGLHSETRHKWALLGIILGAVGLFLAIALAIVYFVLVFGVW